MSTELKEWVNNIDIWKDGIKDVDFVDIKNELIKDMESLWELCKAWKISKEEYSRYGQKFKEILEKNFVSKNEVWEKFSQTRQKMQNETKGLLINENQSFLEKIWLKKSQKTEINIAKIIDKSQFEIFDDIKKLIETNKLNELQRYLLNNPKERKIFLEKIQIDGCFLRTKEENDIFIIFTWIIKNEELKYTFKSDLIKNYWEIEWNKIYLDVQNILKEKSCNFDLIKYFNELNKNRPVWMKITSAEIKTINKAANDINTNSRKNELSELLIKYHINIDELEWKNSQDRLEFLRKKWISKEEIEVISKWINKFKIAQIAKVRSEIFTENDYNNASSLIEKWISYDKVMNSIEEYNPNLKNFNKLVKNIESNWDNFGEIEKAYKKSKEMIKSSKENSHVKLKPEIISQIDNKESINIKIISWMSREEKREFFSQIFKKIENGESKKILSAWVEITITGNNWIYQVKYWDRTINNLWRREVKEAVSFLRFLKPIWLDFLVGHSTKIIEKINSTLQWSNPIKDSDGMDDNEKNLCYKKLWVAILGETNYKESPVVSDNKKQFKSEDSKKKIQETKANFLKNSSYINDFLEKIV